MSQLHAIQQVMIARVVLQGLETGKDRDVGEKDVTDLGGALEPLKGEVVLVERGCGDGDCDGHGVTAARHVD